MVSEHGRVASVVGGCGCGAVRFEVDLGRVSATTRCSCAECRRVAWCVAPVGDDGVELITGLDVLVRVAGDVPRLRCSGCGVDVFGEGRGGLSVNVRCVPAAAALPVRVAVHL